MSDIITCTKPKKTPERDATLLCGGQLPERGWQRPVRVERSWVTAEHPEVGTIAIEIEAELLVAHGPEGCDTHWTLRARGLKVIGKEETP